MNVWPPSTICVWDYRLTRRRMKVYEDYRDRFCWNFKDVLSELKEGNNIGRLKILLNFWEATLILPWGDCLWSESQKKLGHHGMFHVSCFNKLFKMSMTWTYGHLRPYAFGIIAKLAEEWKFMWMFEQILLKL